MTWGPGGKGSQYHDLTATVALGRKKRWLEPFPELWRLVQEVLERVALDGILNR